MPTAVNGMLTVAGAEVLPAASVTEYVKLTVRLPSFGSIVSKVGLKLAMLWPSVTATPL